MRTDPKPPYPYGLLVCAVRYALGRRSYVTGEVCDYVRASLGALTDSERGVIARDIREAFNRDAVGDMCDRTEWMRLLLALDPEADERYKAEWAQPGTSVSGDQP